MVLKVVKPKKKIYKIAYATLNYVKQIHSNDESIIQSSNNDELTEAEKLLAEIRKNGNAPINNNDDDLDFDEDPYGTRSLSSVKMNEYDVALNNARKQFEEKLSNDMMDDMMNILSNTENNEPIQIKVASKQESPMSNLKGITFPIIQETKPITQLDKIAEAVNGLNWSVGAR